MNEASQTIIRYLTARERQYVNFHLVYSRMTHIISYPGRLPSKSGKAVYYYGRGTVLYLGNAAASVDVLGSHRALFF